MTRHCRDILQQSVPQPGSSDWKRSIADSWKTVLRTTSNDDEAERRHRRALTSDDCCWRQIHPVYTSVHQDSHLSTSY